MKRGGKGEKCWAPLLLAAGVVACGSDPAAPGAMSAAGMTSAGMSSAGTMNASGNDAGGSSGGVTGGAAGKATGGDGGSAGTPTTSAGPMQLISRGVPSFASSGMAASANDDKPNIAWSSEALPAWLAYDVSAVPAAQRKQVLLAWYCYFADYMVAEPKPEQMLPLDYTVEMNAAAGGGQPPADGWTEVATVTANSRSARQHVFDLAGGNWVRMSISKASDAGKALVDMDLYSAPSGGSDAWLFMGDSITYMTTARAFSDLPDLVTKAEAGRVPLVIDGALGGTNTTTAQDIIDASIAEFEGKYIVLAYGTNDHAAEYQMESLVQKVIAAGKTPVVPHVPWSDQKLEEGPLLNQNIDSLYAKYPEILKGPDLWAAFENKLDMIPHGDVHPNDPGREFLREQWATLIGSVEP